MSWKQFFERGPYEPLPTNILSSSSSPSRRSNQRRYLITAGLLLVFVGLIWSATRIFTPKPRYNPLDNYQNINTLPIVNANYHTPEYSSDKRAVVSTLYSDSFVIAVAVVGHSTRAANVSARLILPYLEDRISSEALCITRAVGWQPHAVPFIPPPHNGRGVHYRFKDQYTKLNIWSFDQMGIESLVYIDADTLVRRNFDELFDSPFNFAAVPDVYGAGDPRGFSITFNAGVLVLRPSSSVLQDMVRKTETAEYPLQQAEQAFLNLYYGGKAVRLPYAYNANLGIKARSPALWEALLDEIRIVHYTAVKPFLDDSRPPNTILTPEELQVVMSLAAGREHGFYAEEIGWWREAYERMMQDKGREIHACYRR